MFNKRINERTMAAMKLADQMPVARRMDRTVRIEVVRRTSVSRRLGMCLAGALRLTAIAAHLAAPLGLLLALAPEASAVTPEQRYTLLQWDNEGGPKRPHPDAFVLAKKLGGQATYQPSTRFSTKSA